MNREIDIRAVLPTVDVPTLILHRRGDLSISIEHARFLAEHIPGAKLVELDGDAHLPWVGDADSIIDEIEEFVTGVRDPRGLHRMLATVLVTDIVGSTERAVELGDRRWRELLAQYHTLVRKQLERFRGREIDTAGDGFLASFDGPARAVKCAMQTDPCAVSPRDRPDFRGARDASASRSTRLASRFTRRHLGPY
jgi:class 3 adenylate cyclase